MALLVRRVRERLAPDGLQCIGTSATMASCKTQVDRNREVAQVASKLFAATIDESNIVSETLRRKTDEGLTVEKLGKKLGAAIDAGVPGLLTEAQLLGHPLAVWVETRLGIVFSDADNRWVRAQPLSVTEAVARLAEDAKRPAERCQEVLRDFLLRTSVPADDEPRSFFAFKLHQFISGAGHAWGTLEAPGTRTVTVDGQQFLPGTSPPKRLYPLHFCRKCGHEYHPVKPGPAERRPPPQQANQERHPHRGSSRPTGTVDGMSSEVLGHPLQTEHEVPGKDEGGDSIDGSVDEGLSSRASVASHCDLR